VALMLMMTASPDARKASNAARLTVNVPMASISITVGFFLLAVVVLCNVC
jgi:hypothetical protein